MLVLSYVLIHHVMCMYPCLMSMSVKKGEMVAQQQSCHVAK